MKGGVVRSSKGGVPLKRRASRGAKLVARRQELEPDRRKSYRIVDLQSCVRRGEATLIREEVEFPETFDMQWLGLRCPARLTPRRVL